MGCLCGGRQRSSCALPGAGSERVSLRSAKKSSVRGSDHTASAAARLGGVHYADIGTRVHHITGLPCSLPWLVRSQVQSRAGITLLLSDQQPVARSEKLQVDGRKSRPGCPKNESL
jgi:hypothetical protein